MAFSYYKSVTIDHTKCGSANSTNFPVLFSRTHADFKSVGNGGHFQSSSGYDAIFCTDYTNPSGTKLDHEIERYVASTGEFIAWVRIPTLSASVDTVYYIVYGDASISTSQENVSGTWNSNYKLVLHLPDGTTLSCNDSTSNANHFTNSNGTALAAEVGGGASLAIASSGKLTRSGLVIPTSAGYLSAWGRIDAAGVAFANMATFVTDKSDGTLQFSLFNYVGGGGAFYAGWYNNGNDKRIISADSGLDTVAYHQFAVRWTNGGTTESFIDNGSRGTTSSLNATFDSSTLTTSIGYWTAAAIYTETRVDEIRLMDVSPTDSWIASEYNTIRDPSTFFTLGSEGSLSHPVSPRIIIIG